MGLKVGDGASIVRTITQDDINRFAELTGDTNPVHLDEQFAAKTRFGKPIAHGLWGLSLISALMGTKLPGPGTVWLGQTLKFSAPIYPGDTITAEVKVIGKKEGKPIYTCETTCRNQKNETILQGEATILLEEVG
jgi:phosphate acetyltransferase